MHTKPLTRQSMTSLDMSSDLSAIRRLLVAAAISSRFCAGLLNDPEHAVRNGFGGEQFLVSDPTLRTMSSIRVSTLPEFIQQLDDALSNRLLVPRSIEVAW
jgi:hypothetical protein